MTKKSLFKGSMRKVSGSAVAVLVALGVLGSTQALAGIATTKHNLGSAGTGVNKFSGTEEICVFCHTPHGADTSASVPLWNRTMSAPGAYTTYNSLGTSSLDGATAPVGSVSLACLSCHDGTQAMNTMINTPGSGTAALAGSWSGANQTAGKITGAITNLSVDLQNDHPVGIQYAGGSTAALPAAGTDYTTFRDPDFNTAKSVSLNGQTVWYVDTGTAGRQKTDMMLYTRTEAAYTGGTGVGGALAATDPQPYVECASCHDPHVSATPTFLRISNASSAVCLACHIK